MARFYTASRTAHSFIARSSEFDGLADLLRVGRLVRVSRADLEAFPELTGKMPWLRRNGFAISQDQFHKGLFRPTHPEWNSLAVEAPRGFPPDWCAVGRSDELPCMLNGADGHSPVSGALGAGSDLAMPALDFRNERVTISCDRPSHVSEQGINRPVCGFVSVPGKVGDEPDE